MYIRRKVFSNVEQPEEQLYSVTMTEEEYDLFSEFMDGYYEALYSNFIDKEGNAWRINDLTGEKTLIADSKTLAGKEDLVKKGTRASNKVKNYKGAGAGNSANRKLNIGFDPTELVEVKEKGVKPAVTKQQKQAWKHAQTAAAKKEAAEKVAKAKAELLKNKAVRDRHFQKGLEKGLESAGFKQAWKNTSKLGKAGIGAAAAGLTAAGAYGAYKAATRQAAFSE
jgi:hypothetical protein